MKSLKLLLLLGVLTLSGCGCSEQQDPSENQEGTPTTDVVDNNNGSNNANNGENNNSNPSVDTKEVTYKISLYNPSCGSTSTEGLNEVLKKYMNDMAGTTFITSVTNTSCQISNNIPSDGIKVLIIGAGSKVGTLTFNFASKVKKVTITAQTYYNPYVETWTEEQNEIPNVDPNSELQYYTDGASPIFRIDLKTTDDTPVEKTVEAEVNNTTFTLGSCNTEKGRVFIKELTFIL